MISANLGNKKRFQWFIVARQILDEYNHSLAFSDTVVISMTFSREKIPFCRPVAIGLVALGNISPLKSFYSLTAFT